MHDDEILAVMQASTGRRILGVGCLAVLGALLIWIGLTRSFDALGWQLFLVVLGAAAVWMGDAMRRATAQKMGLGMDRVVVTVQDHGNTSAASIPLALSVGRARGQI